MPVGISPACERCNGSSGSTLLPMQMFVDYVTGQLGSSAEQQAASKIARVVVAGNLIERVANDDDDVAVYKRKGMDAKEMTFEAALDLLAERAAKGPSKRKKKKKKAAKKKPAKKKAAKKKPAKKSKKKGVVKKKS